MPRSSKHRSDTPLITHKPAFAEKEPALKPCPACGKRAGEAKALGAGKFRHYVECRACGFSTRIVRLPAVAVAYWSKAKLNA